MDKQGNIVSFESLVKNRELDIRDYWPNPFSVFVSMMQEFGFASSDEDLCGTDTHEYDALWALYQMMEESLIPYCVRFILNEKKNANDGSDYKPIDWDAIRSNESVRDFILKSGMKKPR